MDLTALCQGLAQSRSGRLCLYGPPGTGKTATAHWLAESIGVPVHSVRASDLLGPYVGMSERAIAQAFAQARTDGALLLIDEADSFLQERRKAERSWEVTLVNEMLTQVESFVGLLVVSTNLIDGFDQAALRRFDAKVPFGYLLPGQVEALLQRHLRALGFEAAAEAGAGGAVVGGVSDGGFSLAARRLRALPNVTPGDFAAVARRHRFAAFKDAAGFAHAVEEECALKKDGLKRAIGFTG
jgi:SpoVK/Ycf46/Vps4 family AAA+-type ATPase